MSKAVWSLGAAPVSSASCSLASWHPMAYLIFFALIVVKHAQHKLFHFNYCLVQQFRDIKYLSIATVPFQNFSSATNKIISTKH